MKAQAERKLAGNKQLIRQLPVEREVLVEQVPAKRGRETSHFPTLTGVCNFVYSLQHQDPKTQWCFEGLY